MTRDQRAANSQGADLTENARPRLGYAELVGAVAAALHEVRRRSATEQTRITAAQRRDAEAVVDALLEDDYVRVVS